MTSDVGACFSRRVPPVFPYGRTTEPRGELEPMPTQMTRERFALVVPFLENATPRDAATEPAFTQRTSPAPALVEIPGGDDA